MMDDKPRERSGTDGPDQATRRAFVRRLTTAAAVPVVIAVTAGAPGAAAAS